MRLAIQFLRDTEDLSRDLKNAGWRLQPTRSDWVYATLPEDCDEQSVRRQLVRIGLLTSASLRISFLPSSVPKATPIIASKRRQLE
jgi:hypothetical protein